MLKNCLKPVLIRIVTMVILLVTILTVLQNVFSDKAMKLALILYLLLPPTYVVSAYTKKKEDAAFVSTATSLYTLFTIGVFVVLNIVFV